MSGLTAAFWAETDGLLQRLGKLGEHLTVLLIAGVQGETIPADDYSEQSVETEFLTYGEVEQVLASLRRLDLRVRPFFSELAFMDWIRSRNPDPPAAQYELAYNLAHTNTGPGRKALLPAFCELTGLPYTGSDPHVASLARHKFHTGCILSANNVRVPESWLYRPNGGWLSDRSPAEGTRVIFKLTYESASIGLSADSAPVWDKSLENHLCHLSASFRQPVTVQRFVAGTEAEVPIFCLPKESAPGAVGISLHDRKTLGDQFLTYDDVAKDGYGFWNLEEQMPTVAERLCRTAEKAAQYAAKTERLEQRVAVLERILTDRSTNLADEIDRLRDSPLN